MDPSIPPPNISATVHVTNNVRFSLLGYGVLSSSSDNRNLRSDNVLKKSDEDEHNFSLGYCAADGGYPRASCCCCRATEGFAFHSLYSPVHQ
ncbi:hypothetical protein Nepgr_028586 [Nepenthes gracilis]|uniref:Uncharacterized protein n=1 Tax=Nepenthes gracilis TaxID=150966 RepID=A0AAD3Y2J2_NEPGR|nr:hypothetical protein Nepgr_028586 [Nepenthes gracilis]